jgi:hypothetical protein
MVDIENYIPTSVQRNATQVQNFLQTRNELRGSPISGEMTRLQKTSLLGYGALNPEMVRESGAIKSEPRAKVIRSMLKHQVALNDRLDLAGSKRTDLGDELSQIQAREITTKHILDESLKQLPENEQDRAEEIITTSTKEIETIENWIRKLRDDGSITPAQIEIYRSVVNAISTVEFSAILFGPGYFDDRLHVPSDPTDPSAIIDKYSWVMGSTPANEHERALMIMHNITMVAQVIDDRVGWMIDKQLNIPSFAAAANHFAGGDEKIMKRLLDEKKQQYKRKVKDLGLGSIGRRGAFNVPRVAFEAGAFIVRKGKTSERMRQLIIKRVPPRERLYLTGILDTEISGEENGNIPGQEDNESLHELVEEFTKNVEE